MDRSLSRIFSSLWTAVPAGRYLPSVSLFFIFQQAEGELLLETGGAEVRHVDWHMGQVDGGFLMSRDPSHRCELASLRPCLRASNKKTFSGR